MEIRRVQTQDTKALANYFEGLSAQTMQRFRPHELDYLTAKWICETQQTDYQYFIALENNEIVAYHLLKMGILDHDFLRLEKYGVQPNPQTDCTYAPSVADRWQGKGLGKMMWTEIAAFLKNTAKKRVFLWGGVQSANLHAFHFYQKIGFVRIGGFEYQGYNLDMMKVL